MALMPNFPVICPNCNETVEVEVVVSYDALQPVDELRLLLTPRFEHDCPGPPERAEAV